MTRRVLSIAIAVLLGCGSKKEPDKTAAPPEPAAAKPTAAPEVKAPAVDPATFAELDAKAWPVTKLPAAGLALRLPDGVKVSESGKLAMEPVGPYVGLILASGYDLQIDTSGGSLEEPRSPAAVTRRNKRQSSSTFNWVVPSTAITSVNRRRPGARISSL